jgi:putative heme-binding domain-containing protein
VNFHGKRLNHDVLERKGADYTARHRPDFIQFGDPWFRGVDLFYGPDGAVYVSDWSDTGECHNTEAIHRMSGRMYKISFGEPQPWSSDLNKLSNEQLVRLQAHHNDWLVRQARQILQERAARGENMMKAHLALRQMFDREKAVPVRLRALWALYVTGGTDEAWLRKLLLQKDEQIRVWAIQLLVDNSPPTAAALQRFARMARDDKSGLVLTFLASAMRLSPLESRWPLARSLASREEFMEDSVLPLMIWYGIEPAVARQPASAIAFAEETKIPKLRRFVAERSFEDLSANPKLADQVLQLLTKPRDAKFQLAILSGIVEALAGTPNPAQPPSWPEVSRRLEASSDAEVRSTAEHLRALFGDPAALARLRALIGDTHADAGLRRKALQTLLQVHAPNLTSLLLPLLNELEVAPDAIRALAASADLQTTAMLLEKYKTVPNDAARNEIINALASRLLSANALLDAVQHGQIPRQAISATQLSQLRSLNNADLNEKLRSIWPQLDDSPQGKKQLFVRYKKLLEPARLATADRSQGRRVFQQTCGLCHTLFGEGAKIGPELTGADRTNVDYLLENILDPNGIVPDNYRLWTITMKDDRVLNGIVAAKDEQALTLQTISEKVVLPRAEIQSMNESRLSMMPEGLLQTLTDQQVVDLAAYLIHPSTVGADKIGPDSSRPEK